MSFDSHSRRFYLHWLSRAIETEEGETSEAPDAPHFALDGESTNDPAGRDFDEALAQLSSEGRCVCRLCGAIVARDGSVVG
jgi:hypothetical protein